MKKLSDLEDVDLLDLDEEYEDDYEDDEALYESDYDEEGNIPVRKIVVFVMIAAVLLIAIVAAVIVLAGQKDKEPAVETAVSSEADREQEQTVQDGDEADTGEAEEETKLPEEMAVKPDDGAEEEAEQTTETQDPDPQSATMSTDQGTEVNVTELLSSGSVAQTDQVTIGIDVARYQGTIDWAQVAGSGIDFAMVRVGYRADQSREICAVYLTVSDHLSGSLRLRGIRSAGQRAVWADQCPAHGYRHCFYAGDL